MKVAVCFSGCVRSMPGLIKNHRDHLLDLYDCDVYFSLWDHWGVHEHRDTEIDVEGQKISETWKKKLVEGYKAVAWEFEDFNAKKDELVAKKDIYKDSPNLGDINTVSMYYKIQKCFKLVEASGKKYDVVLRIRPDIEFQSNMVFKPIEENKIYSSLTPSRLLNGWGTNDQICYGSYSSMYKQSKTYDNILTLKQKNIITSCLHPELGLLESYKLEGLQSIDDENINYKLVKFGDINYSKESLHVIFNTNERNLPIVNLAIKYFTKHNGPGLFNLTVVSNNIPNDTVHPIHDSRWTVNYFNGQAGYCPSGTHFGPTLSKALKEIKEDYIFFFCDDYILTEHIEFKKLDVLLTMMELEEIDFFSFASSEPQRFKFEPYKVKDIYNIEKDRFYYIPQNFRHGYSVQPCIWKKSSLLELLKHNPNMTLHALDNSSIADKCRYHRSFKKDETLWYEPWPEPKNEYNFKMLCTSYKIFDLCCPPEKFILAYREVIRHGRFHIKENGYGGVERYHGQQFITQLIEDERLKFRPEYAKYLPSNDQTGANT
jgi:hypothetical protein